MYIDIEKNNKRLRNVTIHRKNIEEAIARRLNPLFALDRGRLEIVAVDEANRTLKIRFRGAYEGSPCRETLLKYVVEPTLLEEIEGLGAVEWVD